MNDYEIIFIGKTDPLDPTRRKLFWMRVLKTTAPLGLNVDKSYDYYFLSTFYFHLGV